MWVWYVGGANCFLFSPNQKVLALSLLDSTVKIFFADTLKVLSYKVIVINVLLVLSLLIWT